GERPASDDVSNRDFVNVATLQFTEEAPRIHRIASATRSRRGQEGDKQVTLGRFRRRKFEVGLSRWVATQNQPALFPFNCVPEKSCVALRHCAKKLVRVANEDSHVSNFVFRVSHSCRRLQAG